MVSDCGAIVDVNQGHKKTPDIEHSAALSLQAGTDLSCSMWTPGFNTFADAARKGLVTEDLVTQAAERLYTARFQLGMFDPQGSSLDRIPFSSVASEANRLISRKAAEESIVLLKNNGVLPLKAPEKIAVIGPTADSLPSILGNYVGTPLHPLRRSTACRTNSKARPSCTRKAPRLLRVLACRCRARPSDLTKDSRPNSSQPLTGPAGPSPQKPSRSSRLTGKTPSPHRKLIPTTIQFAGAGPSPRRHPVTTSSRSRSATASLTRPRRAIGSRSTAKCLAKVVFAPSSTSPRWAISMSRPVRHPPLLR